MESLQIARRPKVEGTSGTPVEVVANFLPIKEFEYPSVFHYSFEAYEYRKDTRARTRYVVKVFKKLVEQKFFETDNMPVFDGGRIFTKKEISGFGKKKRAEGIEVRLESNEVVKFDVVIEKQDKVDLSCIRDYVTVGTNSSWNEKVQEVLMALNAYTNSEIKLNYLTLGPKVFFPPPSSDDVIEYLPGGVVLRRGYYQSIRPGWGRLLINVDTCAATFYPHGLITQSIPHILRREVNEGLLDINRLRGGLDRDDVNYLDWYLRNVIVLIHHNKENVQIGKICSVVDKPANKQMTKYKGRPVPLSEYYRNHYRNDLRFPNWPCITYKTVNDEKEKCPLEICEILDGQKFDEERKSRQSNNKRPRLIKDIVTNMLAEFIKKTAVPPDQRFKNIKDGVEKFIRYQANKDLKSINLIPSTDFVKVKGNKARVLPEPVLFSSGKNIQVKDARWDLNKFSDARSLFNWAVVVFDNQSALPLQAVQRAMRELKNALISKGLNVPTEPEILYASTQGSFEMDLTLACNKAIIDKQKHPAPQLIVCIIPRKVKGNSGMHAAVKRVCVTKLGVISQCILKSTVKSERRLRSVFENIALKINGKLGGKNSELAKNELNFKGIEPYMVFGADVYHSGRTVKSDKKKKSESGEPLESIPERNKMTEEEKKSPSIAAVCASMDKGATRYVTRCSMNRTHRNETIEDMENMTYELIREFHNRNKILPQQIVFYRDGVSESHFQKLLNEEVCSMKKAFNRIYPAGKGPKLTFVVVQKRHHARFMPVNAQDRHQNGNCKPGTVVDTEVVVERNFEFFLQSHASPLGTARPTFYHVILNEAEYSIDEMERLTYKLCHLSVRCNLAISHVTPVHYAHNIVNQARYFVLTGDEELDAVVQRNSVKSLWQQNICNFSMIGDSSTQYISLLSKTGKIPVGHSSGRPRKLSTEERRHIEKILKHNHFTTASELKAKSEENDPELEIIKDNRLTWARKHARYNW
ncbi:5176_t:CDS:10, partial [Entrophospora sp. SA101]